MADIASIAERYRLAWLLPIVTAVVLLACGGAERDEVSEIVSAGDLDIFSIRLGDCFQAPDAFELYELDAVPCERPHDNEVYYLFDVPGEVDDWPGFKGLYADASSGCLEAFEPFVGKDYESSRLDINWISPSEESWQFQNDREIACYLYDFRLEALVGSMRASGE